MENVELRKIEGENVFGSRTRLGVCVIFLIENSDTQNKIAQTYYAETGDIETGTTLDPKLTIGEMYDIMKKLTYYCVEADKIKKELNALYDAAVVVELR